MKEKTYLIPNELLSGKGTEVGRHPEACGRGTREHLIIEGHGGILSCAPCACFHLQLFDHVSESLMDFLVEENIQLEEKQPMAFTFSFPCEHAALDKVFSLCIAASQHHCVF